MKTDIFRRTIWYAHENDRSIFVALSVERVKEIIAMNKEGKKPEELKKVEMNIVPKIKEPDYQNVVGQDSISRFDKNKNRDNKGSNRNRGGNRNNNRNRRPR